MKIQKKILIIHEIATSYYKNIIFNELYKKYKNLKVIHLAETAKRRGWNIDLNDIKYPCDVLFKGILEDVKKTAFIKEVLKKLKEEKPDIIYLGGYSLIAYWTALIYAKLKGVKIIGAQDSNQFDFKRVWWKEYIKKVFFKSCDSGLTYGTTSREYLMVLGMDKKKITIKPNVTDSTIFRDVQQKKPEELIYKKHFIYVGRFAKEKNLIFLLSCFRQATDKLKNNEWGLLLVGNGPLEEELKKYIENNAIHNIVFTGFKEKNELSQYYCSSDVFILPSVKEPWGLVTNEAMACGLPVVISKRCGCCADLVKDNGFSFDPYHEEELIEILNKYISNQVDLGYQKQRSLSIISKYTPELAADAILENVKLLANEDNRV